MKNMTAEEQRKRQSLAYENRESIQPGDIVTIKCTEANDKLCYFKLKSGRHVILDQPGKDSNKRSPYKFWQPVEEGQTLELRCSRIFIEANGYGRLVRYEFMSIGLPDNVFIDGPDAQALTIVRKFNWSRE